MDLAEKQREIEHLEDIKELIRRQVANLEQEFEDSKNHIIDINADMWENSHHLIYDFDDVVELQQRSMELTIHTGMAKRNRIKIDILRRMSQTPFFGRIDFAGPHRKEPEPIYIGMNSLTAQSEIRPRVYDWRAPISSMFYDCGVGNASYTGPAGEIKGRITLKRQYKVIDGQFEYIFDSDLAIDDDILQRELSLHSESKLRTIIASIQQEQNRAVRYDAGSNLLVFGAAGSGKTSIGLHRLAWQLYRHRGHLTSANILIISQNDIFSSYIAGIIPELGEEDIRRVSFLELIRREFGESKTVLDSAEQSEYIISVGQGNERLRGILLKYSPDFLSFLEESIAEMPAVFEDVTAFGYMACTGQQLFQRYAAEKGQHLPFTRLERLGGFAADRVEDVFVRNAAEIKMQLLAEMVDAKELDAEYRRMQEAAKAGARQGVVAQADLDAEALYRHLLAHYADSRGFGRDIHDFTMKQLDRGILSYEDGLVLLFIRLVTGQLKADRTIRHVLIDEAQDFSPLQHAIIRKLTTHSAYTVLADVAQAMFSDVNIREKATLQAIYDGETIELTKSYRSTRQINELASKLLEHGQPEYFDRSGPMPQVVFAACGPSAILTILHRLDGEACSVGIITATIAQAEALHQRLGQANIGIIRRSTDAFRSGTVVIPVALAKGLEFDAVVVADCSSGQLHSPLHKRMLYLMCTRALHRLFLVCPGELTALLAPHRECYEAVMG